MFRLVGFLLFIGILAGSQAHAEDEQGAVPTTQYIYFEPALVINFGSSGRIRYLRTEIALKVSSKEAAGKVSQHKPYLRNTLVFLLSGQESDAVNTSQGREILRKQALEAVRVTLQTLEGMPYVDDLFFNTFVVQN
ncbi:flagellar basal body-associated FliL family protein [Oceanobacter antarcticus]|uniref:Flagellar protein FliL n=1 Tax=Oceanobacter antarcticus TaxID=3133425 RepID=A0ABW8NHF2_9GAMM